MLTLENKYIPVKEMLFVPMFRLPPFLSVYYPFPSSIMFLFIRRWKAKVEAEFPDVV